PIRLRTIRHALPLSDSALGCAVQTTVAQGIGYTTLQLNVNLVRAITKDTGLLICEANTIHVGRQMATAEAELKDEQGKLYAHGTTTCLIFKLPM
ncbi:MAG: PaaI family thioesterase, partial [Chloroflexota bacterium]